MPPAKPLWKWTAQEIATATHAGTISATDVVESVLARIDEVNPSLNAVVEILADEARQRARSLDKSAQTKGRLHGVPVTIKINIDQKGHATSNGIKAFEHLIATSDAPIIRNLQAEGAIIIGRTNTPEFSFRADTDNPLYGRTFNPWENISRLAAHLVVRGLRLWQAWARWRMVMILAARSAFRRLQTVR